MTTYQCLCRICGEQFTHEALFLSCSVIVRAGQRYANVPGYCPNNHSADEIRSTWGGAR